MTSIPDVHERYGGLLTIRGGRRVVAQYGRPQRTYRAVRNVAGVIEHGFGLLTVTGPQRRDAVAESLTNECPTENSGRYGFVLEDGTILADAYVFDTGDRLLGMVPPDRIHAVADAWSGPDRTIENVTRDVAVFGVYGPEATESVASICTATTPGDPLSIARGAIREAGVTVIRDDGIAGEEGFLVIAGIEDAEAVFDAIVNRGSSAAPFGYETWERLTLEAGTPLFDTELRDARPGTVGISTAYPGEDAPEPADRQVRGFTASELPADGAVVSVDGEDVGHVTRAVESEHDEPAIGFAVVAATAGDEWTIGEDAIDATAATLPFVDGSERSARIPSDS